jgi:ubiquinone/menaquinone biosynthesis C-methylase UbiE
MEASSYHDTRLQYDPKRRVLWQTLCDAYFCKLIEPNYHVLELGAGYGDFINSLSCARRTAIDLFPQLPKYLQPGVAARIGSVTDLEFLADHSVDFVFASNLFEHLLQSHFATILRQLKRKLTTTGTLNILQPNYRRAYREYFDDYTHVAVYSDISLCDFLKANGYEILECRPAFLPYSIKSRLPVVPALIRLYLISPWKPFAKQMFVRARPSPTSSTG